MNRKNCRRKEIKNEVILALSVAVVNRLRHPSTL